jgi:hypothetical protein
LCGNSRGQKGRKAKTCKAAARNGHGHGKKPPVSTYFGMRWASCKRRGAVKLLP